MIVRAFQRVCCAVLAGGVLLAVVAPGADAVEATPLAATKFTIQTTRTVEHFVDGAVPVFENVPYMFTQAGGHPYQLTTTIRFATEEHQEPSTTPGRTVHHEWPTRDPKDIVVDLPPGLLGDPMAVPRCSLTTVLHRVHCPADTQLGIVRLHLGPGEGEMLVPLVNVTPEAGQSAEFAIENTENFPILETAHLVRTENPVTKQHEYGFTVVSDNLPSTFPLIEVEETFWGVPADPSHDPMRGLFCEAGSPNYEPLCRGSEPGTPFGGGKSSGVEPVPFLTMPTDCAAGVQQATVRADSWEEPGRAAPNGGFEGYSEAPWAFPAATGCGLLSFEPQIAVKPDTSLADEPVELGVDLKVPLNENPEASATPQVRRTVVTLPEGMSVSPGIVDGVRACEASGPEGIDITGPESEKPGLNGELQLAAGHCPHASIVGTAEAITPFLPVPVKGHVYLARPECGGHAPGEGECTEQDALEGKIYKLYLELGGEGEFANTGIEFKVPGEVEVDPATGQLTTSFDNLVQAPYSEVKIDLFGGPRAALANPAVCGPAVTTSDFTPWSAPGLTPEGLLVAGTADATSSSFFDVTGCPGRTSFQPGFVAGTVTPQAGQFSAFTLNISRQDREQYVKGIQVHTPPGLLGMLSSVPLCGEPAADDGTCPEASKIGTTRVATGAGSHPFEIEGNVYLTGAYGGAPFGLSIVVHVDAGPFNLGVRVVRARINVNPENSTLTVTTDETGPYAVPQIVFGVPVRLKRITVNIDRPGFMFNPTNCGVPGQPGSQQVTGGISGSQETVAQVSSSFAVGGCKSLAFKPGFVVSTSGRTSRAEGASLDAKLSFPAGSVGSEANVALVKVDLPKQLPSRLTTLQKACTAQTFEADPANCPAASIVGIVKASTPLLPVGLTGPVYFVSHGGEAFPSLIVVLQGDGVRVDLMGSTFISKAGITSSTFKTVPDVPVSTFELYLPEGKYSALAANGNLCTSKLTMPTAFVAQNGAEIHETTKISVTGCPKPKQAHKKKRKKAKTARHANGRAGR
jgi:hypothetical protein